MELIKEYKDALSKNPADPIVAMAVAIRQHDGQLRQHSKLPYSTHPIEVANILKKEFPDYSQEELCAAYLHDVIEDTDCTVHDLVELGFSSKIINILFEVTQEDGAKYIDYITGMLHYAPAIRVKIADVIHNRSDQPSKVRRERYDLTLYILRNALEEL